MTKELHFCQDNLEKEHKTVRHTIYHCTICGRIIKVRNSELKKYLEDE